MEIVIAIGMGLAAIAILCLLAIIIRVILVWFAKRQGYTSENMPMLYHMIAFGVYFSILFIVHVMYMHTRGS